MTDTQNDSNRKTEESVVFTAAGAFKVQGACRDTLRRLTAEEWPVFVLADTEEQVVIRSSDVSAIQDVVSHRGKVGFSR